MAQGRACKTRARYAADVVGKCLAGQVECYFVTISLFACGHWCKELELYCIAYCLFGDDQPVVLYSGRFNLRVEVELHAGKSAACRLVKRYDICRCDFVDQYDVLSKGNRLNAEGKFFVRYIYDSGKLGACYKTRFRQGDRGSRCEICASRVRFYNNKGKRTVFGFVKGQNSGIKVEYDDHASERCGHTFSEDFNGNFCTLSRDGA